MLGETQMIQKLIEQGFSEVEAQMELANYNSSAEQMFEECNCEDI